MRSGLALAALLLPLSACYVPQPGPPAYAQPGYPPPGYPPQGYPPQGYAPQGYPPPAGYDAYGNIYPGYNYNNGDPTLFVEGAAVPLIFFGGGWGYWDSRHNWHRAPDAVGRHLDQERDAGRFRPRGGEGFGQPRPEGRPPGAPASGGGGFFHATDPGHPPGAPSPGGGQTFFHATDPGRPAAAAAPRPEPSRQEHDRNRDCQQGQRC